MKPLCESPELLRILKAYSPEGSDYAQQLLDMEAHSKNPDMVMPVLGMQGAGKSTLINAMLGEDILPNEVSETTCAPVEIRYGESSRAEVIMKDGTRAQTVNTKDGLRQYVDNEYNPGNELGVARIILYRTHPLLRTGLILVDLPGVGSLTQANEDTTRNYITDLCAALFVFPTSPTITRDTSNFIKAAWRHFHTAYFVQNIWFDDKKQDVRDGLTTNRNTLNSIAGEINATMIGDIIPINIFNAARGAFTKDAALTEASNIGALVQALESFAGNYQANVAQNFAVRVRQFTQSVAETLAQRIRQCGMSREELAGQIERQKEEQTKASEAIDEKIRSIRKAADKAYDTLRDFSRKTADKYTDQLKQELYDLIDAGIVDGEKLTQAVTDYQSRYNSSAIDEACNEYIRVCEPLVNELKGLQDILKKESFMPQIETFNRAQAFKWEKGLQAVIDVAGGGAGVLAWGEVSALVGTAVGGPLGTVAGAAVGFVAAGAVSLIAGVLGGVARKGVTGIRGQQTKRDLARVFDRFRENLSHALLDPYDTFRRGLSGQLKEYKQARQGAIRAIQAELDRLEELGAQAVYDEEALRADRAYLEKWSAENNV